ncbi:MAG TPA: hypothetical protein VL523_12000 [Terriglobia bacterium]|nr:hypothetical protein [Terriglobia bacterium]
MAPKPVATLALAVFAEIFLASLALGAQAQQAATPYPSMAPLDQYLIQNPNDEIALARSAAPKAISDNAEVMVLGRQGYTTAVKGTNGFVCVVERGWTAEIDNPDFWNPKLRGPICFNAPAARTYLPITLAKTRLVLAGKSKAQMFAAMAAAFDDKELPQLEPGAMCYMLSKEGYLNDRAGHWHPHLMFFVPIAQAKAWGANLEGSPIIGADDPQDRLTIFMVTVAKWSDGTPDSAGRP